LRRSPSASLAGLQAIDIAVVASPCAPLFLSAERAAPRSSAPAAALSLASHFWSSPRPFWPVAQQFRLAAVEREIAALKPAAEAALRARQEAGGAPTRQPTSRGCMADDHP
jgi:hypothetical protein